MRALIALLIALASWPTAATSQRLVVDAVEYVVAPIVQNGEVTALEVEVRLLADADGETEFELPNRRARARELWH